MSSRTRARADARRAKKIENQLNFGHSAASSKTLIETCMDEIVKVARQCLELQEDDQHKTHKLRDRYNRLRGRLSGMVWLYCKCWVNPYEPHLSNAVESVRKEAVKRARAQMAEEKK